MLRRFDFAEQLWVVKVENNTEPCKAELCVDLSSLDRLGPPSWGTTGARSPSRSWQLVADCGLEFVVYQDEFFEDIPDHALVVAATVDEVDHALMHLPFAARITARPRYLYGTAFNGGWEVRRVDASGHAFSVGRYPREASARCVANTFELRGHKQTYFVDLLGPPPRVAKGEWLVMRMDDNGQVFSVRAHRTRGGALHHMRMLEETPRHKQTYWVQKLDSEQAA
jgi:hypothetical protein